MGSLWNIDYVYAEKTKSLLAEDLEFLPPVTKKEEIATRAHELSSVSYIFTTWGMLTLTESEIKTYLPSLEAVFYAAGSVRYFAAPFINCGVKVFSAWAANGVPVAQYTAAEILLALKGFFATLHNNDGDEWHRHNPPVRYPGIMDEKVGIIGAGMIGRMVIEELKRYPVEILVYDKFMPEDAISALGAKKAELSEIFSECLVISNHLANNEATVGMLNYDLFSKMRNGAVFINTGRGAQTVTEDMIRALEENKTLTAVLDVTDPEEPPKPGSKLYKTNNVYLTPHIAGSIGNEVHRMSEYMYDEYISLTSGEKTKYEVSLQMLATMA